MVSVSIKCVIVIVATSRVDSYSSCTVTTVMVATTHRSGPGA